MNVNMLKDNLKAALKAIVIELGYADDTFDVVLEEPKDKSNGDFSTNTAMRLAKAARMAPRSIAELIVEKVNIKEIGIEKLEIAGPGFINIYLNKSDFYSIINQVLDQGENYGDSDAGNGTKVLLEYVSANPTGYLHIGHARGGAYGDALANIMDKAGYTVHREFYVNDGGNQINNLAMSIEARYLQELGIEAEMPNDGYFGAEIIKIAKDILAEHGEVYKENSIEFFKEYGLEFLLNGLKEHLIEYRIEFDEWFRERILYPEKVDATVNYLREKGYTYKAEDAEWLKTSDFFDEKDRVIYTSDGRNTYLVPDIAYHKNKFDRGYDILIDVLGADHHGYMDRLRSSMEMIGQDSTKLEFEILQMVKVFQNGEEVKMSKRSGKAIGLQDLLEEVGADPIRYFFAARALSSPMDLDLDLALRATNENPVYYAQYAHARICSVISKAKAEGVELEPVQEFNNLNENANDLLVTLSKYQSIIEECANKRIPHKLANYIQTLASNFHSYYNNEKFITDSKEETMEKLQFISAVKVVLSNALKLIGVSSPEKM
jgi:arginyl-tRNA synthetase